MSEDRSTLFQASFNRSVRIETVDDSLSANGGILYVREADHRLGITRDLARDLHDSRDQSRIRYGLAESLRGRLYGFGAGYAHQDDADELAHDPAMRVAVWNRRGEKVAAERLPSQPTQSRMIDILAEGGNREVLRGFVPKVVERHRTVRSPARIKSGTLDIDSFPVTVYGNQEGAAYNRYYERKVYSPYAAYFSSGGDPDDGRICSGFVHARLRKGNAAPNEGALPFILEAHANTEAIAEHVDVRMDAAFAEGKVMDGLTDRKVRFLTRLKRNAKLEAMAAEHVALYSKQRVDGLCGETECTVELQNYKASTWQHAQRVILVIVDDSADSRQQTLFPRHFFLVTNWPRARRSKEQLLAHYRKRGTFEDRFGELNNALRFRLSSPRFSENEATLLLSLIAFNLVETLRREVEKATGTGWDMQRFQRTALNIGARLSKGARKLRFLVMRPFAEVATLLAGCLRSWRRIYEADVPKSGLPKPPPPHSDLSPTLRL